MTNTILDAMIRTTYCSRCLWRWMLLRTNNKMGYDAVNKVFDWRKNLTKLQESKDV